MKIIRLMGVLRTKLIPAPNKRFCRQNKRGQHAANIVLNSLSMI